MGKYTDKELAARTAAYFNMWVIETCYTGQENEETQVLGSGLTQNGTFDDVFELLEKISSSGGSGATFRLSDMTTVHAIESQQLAEMFAAALLKGAGPKEEEYAKTTIPDKDPEISAALRANSLPTLARFFQPVFSS
jgi:hypothetical protein